MRRRIRLLYVFALLIILSACGGGSSDDGNGSSAPGITAASAGVTIIAGNGEITISWSPVPDATSYNIYWSNSPGVTKLSGTKIAGVNSPFTQKGLTNGLTYYYVGTAVNSAGESSESSEVSATPSHTPIIPGTPAGVTVLAGNEVTTISWSSVPDATSYNIYWSNSPGVTKLSGTKIVGVTSAYTHTGLLNGTIYYYIVTALNIAGEGSESIEVSVTPSIPIVAPAKPTAITASAGNEQITISWSLVPDATSYNIYWSNSPGVTKLSGTKIVGVTSVYTHEKLVNGTTYYYIVTALNSAGEGSESSEVSETPFLAPPPPPI